MGDRRTGTAERETGRIVRWWQRGRDTRRLAATGSGPRGPRRMGVGLFLVALALVAVLAVSVRLATRRRVPADPVRPQVVEPFSLRDTRGRVHELADWRDARAVVLFVIGTEGPTSRGFAPEMRRLAERLTPARRGGVLRPPPRPRSPGGRRGAVCARALPGVPDPARPRAQELAAGLGVRVHVPRRRWSTAKGISSIRGRSTTGRVRAARVLGVLDAASWSRRSPRSSPGPRLRPSGSGGIRQPPAGKPAPLVGSDQTITFRQGCGSAPLAACCAGCHRPGEGRTVPAVELLARRGRSGPGFSLR